MPILILNPGSSTLKFTLLDGDSVTSDGVVERLGTPQAMLKRSGAESQPVPDLSAVGAVERVIALFDYEQLSAIGCRVVMGGAKFVDLTQVDAEVIAEIRRLGSLAPLHNPVAADTLEACQKVLPDIPLYAVFDTAFHATLPPIARTYALPHDLCEREGLHRYGFHGIAHRWVSERLRERLAAEGHLDTRFITCHLGSGVSACAVLNGKSIDTTMGLTPMEGLMMGTRSGDVDPGLLLHLQTQLKMSPTDVERILNKESGFLGVSGVSADLRDVEKAASSGDPQATLAVELFAYRVAKTIGAFTVVLGGLDAVAFSGGIGENSAPMRARICRRLAFLGMHLDNARNEAGLIQPGAPTRITQDTSTVQAWIVPADESRQIAREINETLTGP